MTAEELALLFSLDVTSSVQNWDPLSNNMHLMVTNLWLNYYDLIVTLGGAAHILEGSGTKQLMHVFTSDK